MTLPIIGSRAPSLLGLADQAGHQFDLTGREFILVFFRASDLPITPAPSCEMASVPECATFGISLDSEDEIAGFVLRFGLPFDLLHDPDGSVARGFGIGRDGSRLPCAVRIGADGVVLGVWEGDVPASQVPAVTPHPERGGRL